ncbi:hypothetical protein NAEX_04144 [Nannocystis exedens]|nr:hypothetical protein NAEX_04144 [Nannocystis exedens]
MDMSITASTRRHDGPWREAAGRELRVLGGVSRHSLAPRGPAGANDMSAKTASPPWRRLNPRQLSTARRAAGAAPRSHFAGTTVIASANVVNVGFHTASVVSGPTALKKYGSPAPSTIAASMR